MAISDGELLNPVVMNLSSESRELKEAESEQSSAGSLCCGKGIIGAIQFLVFLFYIQLVSVVGFVSLIFGLGLGPGLVCEHFLWLTGTRYAHTPNSQLLVDDTVQPVIFLANHRSWGDFWVDNALIGGPSFMARALVAVAIPFSALWGWLQGWLWFFVRGAKREEGTRQWMQNFCLSSHQNYHYKGVVIYPEGTRTLLPKGGPLKFGGIAAAYRLGWPVQIVITTNKEEVMAEKSLAIGCNVRCVTCVSPPILPESFVSEQEFVDWVQQVWHSTWEEAYGPVWEHRSSALLPGAKQTGTRCILPWRGSNLRVNIARLVLGLAILLMYLKGR